MVKKRQASLVVFHFLASSRWTILGFVCLTRIWQILAIVRNLCKETGAGRESCRRLRQELALQSRREREGGGSAANATRDGERERGRVGNVLHIAVAVAAVRSDMDKGRRERGHMGRGEGGNTGNMFTCVPFFLSPFLFLCPIETV